MGVRHTCSNDHDIEVFCFGHLCLVNLCVSLKMLKRETSFMTR